MQPKVHILFRFLRADGGFVSGESLATDLDLSRVSVWNHLEQLKQEGFAITAIRNKGYRLDAMPQHLHPDMVAALLLLQPIDYFKSCHVVSKVGSTNSVVEQLMASAEADPLVVVADEQTSGRGRRGRAWHSPPHRNLYVSVGLRPNIPPARLQTITLWIGLQLALWLRNAFSLPVQVKWPNDLMLHGRKIAGILSEARVDAESTRELVIGIGLNVNTASGDFPPEIADIAASLVSAGAPPQTLSLLCHQMLQCLAAALDDFFSDHFADDLANHWPVVDFLAGRHVSAGQISGTVIGINSVGALRVQREDGFVAVLNSGEVSLDSSYRK